MALICPINGNLCNSDCAWRVGEKCVTVDIAMSFRRGEIRKYAFETLSNMRYGTTIMKDGKSYFDTDSIGPYDEINSAGRDIKMKTPEDMYYEGWCKDCDYCFKKCLNKGVCKGYSLEEENNGTEEPI